MYVDQLWLREELPVTNFQGKVAFPKEAQREKGEDMIMTLVFGKKRIKISSRCSPTTI